MVGWRSASPCSYCSASQSSCGQRGLLFSFQPARYVNLGFKHRLQKATNRKKNKRKKSVTRSTPGPGPRNIREYSHAAHARQYSQKVFRKSRRGLMLCSLHACAVLCRGGGHRATGTKSCCEGCLSSEATGNTRKRRATATEVQSSDG